MRRAILLLPVLALAAAVGCWQKPEISPAEKEFRRLYRDYSDQFHEKMVSSAEQLPPIQITAEAAHIWDSVFAGHEDVVRARQKELLAELDAAPAIDKDLYLTVDEASRTEDKNEPKGIVLKQFLWSPEGAAQFYLNNWLARLMNQQSYAVRSVLLANAELSWEVQNRNPDSPILIQREGPMIFLVELTRQQDYYVVEKLTWLRPKSLGPITPPPEGTGTGGGATPPSTPAPTPAPTPPPEGAGSAPRG